jgi:PAS domain S-box-containing protein
MTIFTSLKKLARDRQEANMNSQIRRDELDESGRLKALDRYNILDTEPEVAYDDIVWLAAQICQTPVAFLGLLSHDRFWVKAQVNFPIEDIPRDLTFCGYAKNQDGELVIEDTLVDARFATNPFVANSPNFRFYAGVPLNTPDGYRIGSICVVDFVPRQLNVEQMEGLHALSRQAMSQLELRCNQAKQLQFKTKLQTQALLLDQVTNAIIMQDFDQRITFWNQGAEQLYGWSTAEAIGQSAPTFLHGDTSIDLQAIYQSVHTTGHWQGELTQLTKEQQPVIVSSRWSLCQEGGKPDRVLIVNTDITQTVLLERQLLRNQRLESIGTLAGGIAHDLNNILAPIVMSVSLLEQQPESEKRQKWLNVIDKSADRAASLVKQVLTFARGHEDGRTLMEVKHLIYEVKQVIEETFPKNINISTFIPNDLWAMWGDVTQIHQILMNLCLNARDAMPQGGMIRVAVENVELQESPIYLKTPVRPGSYIAITISDTGMGISQNIIDRIFDPFFTTKSPGNGTGLGLSTVMTIIKRHNGFLSLSSEENRGTEFKVYLPAVAPVEQSQPATPELPIGTGEWVLVVDDEPLIRQAVKAVLELNGYRVLTAPNGVEAIAAYTQYQDDVRVVLMDIMMPVMDGTIAIRTLQVINPKLKIIAASGLANSHMLKEMGIEVSCFLAKPYDAQDLLVLLRQVLDS